MRENQIYILATAMVIVCLTAGKIATQTPFVTVVVTTAVISPGAARLEDFSTIMIKEGMIVKLTDVTRKVETAEDSFNVNFS